MALFLKIGMQDQKQVTPGWVIDMQFSANSHNLARYFYKPCTDRDKMTQTTGTSAAIGVTTTNHIP